MPTDGRCSDVGEMLLEADPIYGPAPSFDRERQVRKHIGDYTLFFSGMFPESINHYRLRRQRLENFVDFIKAGKESYYIVSKFDQFEYARLAPLFAKLAKEFESCVYGLNLVKGDLEEMQHPITRQAKADRDVAVTIRRRGHGEQPCPFCLRVKAVPAADIR